MQAGSHKKGSPEWFDAVLPAEYLRQRLDYDPETGLFVWRDAPGLSVFERIKVGKPALTGVNAGGYRNGSVAGVQVFAHRVVWAIVTGRWPVGQVDHVNRVRKDNRWGNLREVTVAQNGRNRSPLGQKKARVPAIGVKLHSRRFRAELAGEKIGTFRTVGEAVAARYRAEQAHGWPPRAETLEQAVQQANEAWQRQCRKGE